MKNFFTSTSNHLNRDLGLLIIRLMMGILMACFGYEKLIHFSEMAATPFWANEVSFLGMSGKFPLALTIFTEFICSITLILGFMTRFSLLILMFCMGYIFVVVFPGSIVGIEKNGAEFNPAFTYFIIYLGLLFTGPGRYSLDYKLFTKI